MKKLILIAASTLLLAPLAQAQVSSSCKNPCTKQRVVETGAFIGVRITNGPGCKNAQIMEVLPNTAAQANKFEVGDIITKVDNIEIENTPFLVDLIQKNYQPGDIVKINYLHLNKATSKNVKLGAMYSRTITEVVCCDVETPKTDDVAAKQAAPAISNANFAISPNPASTNISITANEVLNGTATVKFFDLLGREVYSVDAQNSGMINIGVNVSSLKEGNYVVKLIGASKQFTQKLIIAK
jgi:membrane-associated protease RseP (regulator of RpoE activity)